MLILIKAVSYLVETLLPPAASEPRSGGYHVAFSGHGGLDHMGRTPSDQALTYVLTFHAWL